jgi:hypothetical protein
MQANGAPQGAVGQATWWSYLVGAASPAANAVETASAARPQSMSPTASSTVWQSGVWQSVPAEAVSSEAAGDRVSAASTASNFSQEQSYPGFARPLHPSSQLQEAPATERPSTTSKLAEGIAAGLQERFSSISHLSSLISNKRRARQSAPVVDTAAPAAVEVTYPCNTGWEAEQATRAEMGRPDGNETQGLWQVMWKEDSILRVLPFKSSPDVRLALQNIVCPLFL